LRTSNGRYREPDHGRKWSAPTRQNAQVRKGNPTSLKK
jgi:hypothetical protein